MGMSKQMEKNIEPVKEILNELFGVLETLEAQSLAVMQFLKDQGIATDDKLAPYLDRAGSASSVKWRAARARMQYLLSPIQREEAKDKDKDKEARKEATEQGQLEKKQPEKLEIKEQTTKSGNESSNADKKSSDAGTAAKKEEAGSPASDTDKNAQKNEKGNVKGSQGT